MAAAEMTDPDRAETQSHREHNVRRGANQTPSIAGIRYDFAGPAGKAASGPKRFRSRDREDGGRAGGVNGTGTTEVPPRSVM